MSDYQVTGWLAWQHHMALVLMASLYILNLKEEIPLLSVRDARLLVIAITFATKKEVDLCLEHIRIRHQKRQADIDKNRIIPGFPGADGEIKNGKVFSHVVSGWVQPTISLMPKQKCKCLARVFCSF